MKILLIILSVIGLLRVVSLFILVCTEVYYKIKKVDIMGIKRTHGIYKISECYIIPTFKASFTNGYFEPAFMWLWFEYYCCYSIDKDEDESSSV